MVKTGDSIQCTLTICIDQTNMAANWPGLFSHFKELATSSLTCRPPLSLGQSHVT